MRKIPREYENYIDDILIDLCDSVSESFYLAGFTPNLITTLSNLCAIICALLIYNDSYILAGIFYMLSYFFDCLDGHMARKYKLVTPFGDYYDHISDVLKNVLVFGVMWWKNSTKFFNTMPVLIVFFFLANVHYGCQEIYYNKKDSSSMSLLKKLCPIPNETDKETAQNVLLATKFFGFGTFNLITAIIIMSYGTEFWS